MVSILLFPSESGPSSNLGFLSSEDSGICDMTAATTFSV
jgi:hypothetical protein